MITTDSIVVASPDQVSSDLAGEIVMLNLASGTYYGLDEVGARIWNLVQQPTPVSAAPTAAVTTAARRKAPTRTG